MARQVNQVLWDQWRQRIEETACERAVDRRVLPKGKHLAARLPRLEAEASPSVTQRGMHPRADREVAAFPAATVPSSRRAARARKALAGPAMPPRPTDFLQLPVTAAQGSPWIELALADGTILRLPQQNLAALITALRVLRGERLELPWGESRHA